MSCSVFASDPSISKLNRLNKFKYIKQKDEYVQRTEAKPKTTMTTDQSAFSILSTELHRIEQSSIWKYTVSKKVPTFKLSVTLSNRNRKAYEICYKTHTTLPTSP